MKNYKGRTIDFEIDNEKTGRLKSIAESEGVTMFMMVLSIYNLLLSKLSNQEDIAVGIPVTDRPHADLGNVIGMFVNTLVLHNSIEKT